VAAGGPRVRVFVQDDDRLEAVAELGRAAIAAMDP
jgi:hypothetical protein